MRGRRHEPWNEGGLQKVKKGKGIDFPLKPPEGRQPLCAHPAGSDG